MAQHFNRKLCHVKQPSAATWPLKMASAIFRGRPPGDRTLDLILKRDLLYQLS